MHSRIPSRTKLGIVQEAANIPMEMSDNLSIKPTKLLKI